jgi:hypothetical protein
MGAGMWPRLRKAMVRWRRRHRRTILIERPFHVKPYSKRVRSVIKQDRTTEYGSMWRSGTGVAALIKVHREGPE